MPRVFWMKMSCKKVFSMIYFIQINFIKNDLNKNVLNKKRRGRCFIAYVRFSLRIKNVILYWHASAAKIKNKVFQSRDLYLRALDTNSVCAKSVCGNERKTP